MKKIQVYLETGTKKTFAGAIDWPGWCRSGRDADSALQALREYGARYARVVGASKLGFQAPTKVSALEVVERLKGDATTDFGAPSIAPAADAKPVSAEELHAFEKILKACWRTFDADIKKASGKKLTTGPRGGGRQLEGMIEHVLGSDASYVNQVGWKFRQDETASLNRQLRETRQAILDGLKASARGEIPPRGPRGGVRWTACYFVRRIAWHTLDHAWEIEDRIISG
jgi:hypothetical protein